MTARRALCAFLSLAACANASYSAQPGQQPMSVVEFVNHGVMSRMGATAEVCTKHLPGSAKDWERTLGDTSAKVDRFTEELLGTTVFASLDKTVLPRAVATETLKANAISKDKIRDRVENDHPDAKCPQILTHAQVMSDEYLRASVTVALATLQWILLGLKDGYVD
jgi:hypothetical protein